MGRPRLDQRVEMSVGVRRAASTASAEMPRADLGARGRHAQGMEIA